MRVLGIACAWIFCGFYRSAWIYPWTRPYRRTSRRAKCTRKTHASPTSRGYWGYWGYFSQTLENAGFFELPHRGYFGGYFRGRGFPRARYPCVCVLRWRLDAGNPYCEQWALRRCSEVPPTHPVVPTKPTVSVLAMVRHFRTVVTRAGKCVSGERTRNPPPRFPRSFPCAS